PVPGLHAVPSRRSSALPVVAPATGGSMSSAQKLLVTGGAGYIGSVCSARLLEAGHDVVVVDDLSTGHADAVPRGARFIEGDVAGDRKSTRLNSSHVSIS